MTFGCGRFLEGWLAVPYEALSEDSHSNLSTIWRVFEVCYGPGVCEFSSAREADLPA